MNDKPKRGEVWYYKPTYESNERGHIQTGERPVIIVSNNLCNDNSSVILSIPCTTRPKKNLPTHVLFTIDNEFNIALAEQAGPILAKDLVNRKYILDDYLMEQVDAALNVAYGLVPVYSRWEKEDIANGTC